MKIAFHGAARTVTGSKHLLTLNNGNKYLLDCGLFQGLGKDTDPLNREFKFDPSTINYLILSHAHIDHSGLIPKLVREGFKGKIFATPATKALATILLEDSAGIQQSELKYINKSRTAQGLTLFEPLYSIEDVQHACSMFVVVDYNTIYKIDESVSFIYKDAGHIIGSATVHLTIHEDSKQTNLSFSGDVGRYTDAILRAPDVFPQADYIIMESTYGNSLHDEITGNNDLLLEWITKICVEKKGKLIMPAFSVGRTQEILFQLNQLSYEKRLPQVPYYVDSPLSMEATAVIKSYPQYFNQQIRQLLEADKDPFDFPGLKFISSVEESKGLNFYNGPCVIISASGMADAGRVKHHISNNIENSRNGILLTGYCEPHSLGGRLKMHPKEVNIFGFVHEVNAQIGEIRSMSAHGDYNDLIHWLACQDKARVKKLFLVHGDYKVQQDLRERLLPLGFPQIEIPNMHEEVSIG